MVGFWAHFANEKNWDSCVPTRFTGRTCLQHTCTCTCQCQCTLFISWLHICRYLHLHNTPIRLDTYSTYNWTILNMHTSTCKYLVIDNQTCTIRLHKTKTRTHIYIYIYIQRALYVRIGNLVTVMWQANGLMISRRWTLYICWHYIWGRGLPYLYGDN